MSVSHSKALSSLVAHTRGIDPLSVLGRNILSTCLLACLHPASMKLENLGQPFPKVILYHSSTKSIVHVDRATPWQERTEVLS